MSQGSCRCVPSLSHLRPGHGGRALITAAFREHWVSRPRCWLLGPFFTFSEWTQEAETGKEERVPPISGSLEVKLQDPPLQTPSHQVVCLLLSCTQAAERRWKEPHATMLPDWLSCPFILADSNGHAALPGHPDTA